MSLHFGCIRHRLTHLCPLLAQLQLEGLSFLMFNDPRSYALHQWVSFNTWEKTLQAISKLFGVFFFFRWWHGESFTANDSSCSSRIQNSLFEQCEFIKPSCGMFFWVFDSYNSPNFTFQNADYVLGHLRNHWVEGSIWRIHKNPNKNSRNSSKKNKRVRDLLLQDDPRKMPKLTIFFCCIRAQNPRKDKAEKDAYLRRQQKGFELSLYVN